MLMGRHSNFIQIQFLCFYASHELAIVLPIVIVAYMLHEIRVIILNDIIDIKTRDLILHEMSNNHFYLTFISIMNLLPGAIRYNC